MNGQKEKQVPIINDYIYRHKSTGANSNSYWKCSNARCNARAVTSNGKLIKTSGEHMHSTDFNNLL